MAVIILTGQMPVNHFIDDGKETAMLAVGAFYFRFLAQTASPLIGASRLIAAFAGFATLEAAWINIITSTKERPKQGDLCLNRGVLIDMIVFRIHGRL
jgi:hypothetical protein